MDCKHRWKRLDTDPETHTEMHWCMRCGALKEQPWLGQEKITLPIKRRSKKTKR